MPRQPNPLLEAAQALLAAREDQMVTAAEWDALARAVADANPSERTAAMNAQDIQAALVNLFDTLEDARDEIEGDDDDITLADHLRDIADDFDGIVKARSYQRDAMLTTDAGLTIRTAGGAEFQITIVQSRRGTDDNDD
jgi:hypothetical protein